MTSLREPFTRAVHSIRSRSLVRVLLPAITLAASTCWSALAQDQPAPSVGSAAGEPGASEDAAASSAGVAEAPVPPDSEAGADPMPQTVGDEHFTDLKTRSPFLRALNLADTYSLRAVANIGGVPVATLYNRETEKTITVAKGQPNEAGIEMVEVISSDELTGVSVKVSFGGEVVELVYEQQQLAPQPTRGPQRSGDRGNGDSDQRRGPSDEERKRYESLTDEQKQKFHEYARQTMQKYPDMSREERFNMIRGALARLSETGEIPQEAPGNPGGGGDGSDAGRGGGDQRR